MTLAAEAPLSKRRDVHRHCRYRRHTVALLPERDPLIALCLSGEIYGAQNRLLKLYRLLRADDVPVDALLLVTPSLYAASRSHPFASAVLDDARRCGRLIVMPNRRSVYEALKVSSGWPLLFARRPKLALVSVGMQFVIPRLAQLNWPVVYEVTSPDVADRVDHHTVARASAVLCVSLSVEARLRANLGRAADATTIKHMTLPFTEAIAPPERVKDDLIVSASRFIARKNVHVFAAALREVLPKLPGWQAAILGRGDEAPIRAALGPLDGDQRIFIGHVNGIGDYVARSKILVSLIEPDNFPSQSVMEAMTAKNALILSDTGNSKRFLPGDPPENGILVPLTQQDVADAIHRLANDPERLRKAGEVSEEIVTSRFQPNAYLFEYLSHISPHVR